MQVTNSILEIKIMIMTSPGFVPRRHRIETTDIDNNSLVHQAIEATQTRLHNNSNKTRTAAHRRTCATDRDK